MRIPEDCTLFTVLPGQAKNHTCECALCFSTRTLTSYVFRKIKDLGPLTPDELLSIFDASIDQKGRLLGIPLTDEGRELSHEALLLAAEILICEGLVLVLDEGTPDERFATPIFMIGTAEA